MRLWKRQRKPHTTTSFIHTIGTFHVVFAFASILALIITTLYGKDILLYLEFISVSIVLVVNAYIFSRKRVTEEGEELSLLYTFCFDKIKPPQTGREQRYNVTVAFVEDAGQGYFRDRVQEKFKTELNWEQFQSLLAKTTRSKNPLLKEPNLEKLVLEEVKDRHLYFQPINVKPPTKAIEQLTVAEVEQLETDFKQRLNDDLEKPTAVIVVSTSELDEKSWVYRAVTSWADKHAEIPILFAKKPEKDLPANTPAKKFLSMPDDPRSLPWRLLQRAKNRAKVWRIQATYNKAMIWNLFYVLLLCVYAGAILYRGRLEEFVQQIQTKDAKLSDNDRASREELVTQQSKFINTMNGMAEAIKTEKRYREFTSKKDDPTLSVSYWYGFMEEPFVFVTTEFDHSHTNFKKDYTTVIGCGFSAPNHVIEWTFKSSGVSATAYDFNGEEVSLPEPCSYWPLPQTPIRSIVCATFNDKYNDKNDSIITNRTVGVCVFTESVGNNIFSKSKESRHKFLIDTIKNFHSQHINSLENNNVISLDEAERLKKTLLVH